MNRIRARVEKGRLVVDEPTELPEGTVLDLVADDEGDNLSDEERAALHAAIERSANDAESERVVPAEDLMRNLRDRS